MKFGFIAHGLMAIFVLSTSLPGRTQSPDADQDLSAPLKIDSAFVWVPALVKTKYGETLIEPDVSRFRLLDNGTLEKLTEVDTNGLPISLVVLMQTGGLASRFLSNYTGLPELIGGLVGGSVHEIALVTFDSRIEEVWHFPSLTDAMDYALTHQAAGDMGAAIKDAVAFGVQQLQGEPGRFRRIVILLSQGRDVGSSISSRTLVEQLGASSTVVYSLTFQGEKTHAGHVHKTGHGGVTDETLETTSRALDDQAAEEIALLTGGTDFQFHDRPGFNSAILGILSDFHNGILLGFQPSRHEVGFHRIKVQADSPKLRVTARRAYWARPE